MDEALASAVAWSAARTYRHDEFSADRLRRERDVSVSICVPAREEAATIGPIVTALVALREQGVVDEVVVLDAAPSRRSRRGQLARGQLARTT